MPSLKAIERDLSALRRYFERNCTIGDVVVACGECMATAEPHNRPAVEDAKQKLTVMAHRHGKPVAVAAMFALAELIEVLPSGREHEAIFNVKLKR